MQPLKKGNLSEQVYETIRNALMDGRYQPGERLTIRGLADELAVSITPVREAIFRLVSERALEMKAATAIHVPIISADQLREIQLIRGLLEGQAAETAAQNATPERVARLEAIQQAFQEALLSDPLKASYHNRDFHFALLEMVDLKLLYATVENMWVLMGPLLRMYHQQLPTRDLNVEDHDHNDVLRGLRQKDGAMAREAIQNDIRLGLKLVEWLEAKGQEAT